MSVPHSSGSGIHDYELIVPGKKTQHLLHEILLQNMETLPNPAVRGLQPLKTKKYKFTQTLETTANGHKLKWQIFLGPRNAWVYPFTSGQASGWRSSFEKKKNLRTVHMYEILKRICHMHTHTHVKFSRMETSSTQSSSFHHELCPLQGSFILNCNFWG